MIEIKDCRAGDKYLFAELEVGETFIFNGVLYQKIQRSCLQLSKITNIVSENLDSSIINCISLDSGYKYFCPGDAEVEKVQCKIVIEKSLFREPRVTYNK